MWKHAEAVVFSSGPLLPPSGPDVALPRVTLPVPIDIKIDPIEVILSFSTHILYIYIGF